MKQPVAEGAFLVGGSLMRGVISPTMRKRSEGQRPEEIRRLRDGAARPAASASAPVMLVVSRDSDLIKLASDSVTPPWIVEQSADHEEGWRAMVRPRVKLVVIDDDGIDETARGWLLGQTRKHAPDAMVVYIASAHNSDVERHVRAHQVQYYTSRPVDRERVHRVLASFANAAYRDGRGSASSH